MNFTLTNFIVEIYDMATILCSASSCKKAVGSEKIRLRFLCSVSQKSRVISRDFIRGSHLTAAIMAFSSVSVRTVRGRSEFSSVIDVILPIPLESSSSCRNILAFG